MRTGAFYANPHADHSRPGQATRPVFPVRRKHVCCDLFYGTYTMCFHSLVLNSLDVNACTVLDSPRIFLLDTIYLSDFANSLLIVYKFTMALIRTVH
jgi:hypothetical protein